MKKITIIISVLVVSLGFYASYRIDKAIADVLKQLELTEESAQDYIWSDISYSSFNYPYPGKLKEIAKDDRAAIVKSVAQYVKDYTKTEAFKQKYLEYREYKKPEPPEKPQSMGEMRNNQKEQMKKSIEEMKQNMKNIPADQKPMIEGIIKNFEQQLADMENADNSQNDAQSDEMIKQGYESQMQEYETKLAEWEKEYPVSDPSFLIKRWLNDFLKESADVDFNAELRNNNYGKKVFVKSEYEEKSHLWKLCFRTGKESVAAARSFAQAWLKELK